MRKRILILVAGILFPALVNAQGFAEKIHSLHSVLDVLYEQMIPMCDGLIVTGQGIAGIGAMCYISLRVWRHIANAEPIDFYPLFRPFVLGFCIAFFPLILDSIRGLLMPIENATAAMVKDSNSAIKMLLKEKDEAIKKSKFWEMYVGIDKRGDRDKWLRYTYGLGENEALPWQDPIDMLGNEVKFSLAKVSYNFRNTIKEALSQILEILFQAASLCINTLRTFQLVILGILGPVVFGIAVFDGLQQTLSAWFARYINVFLWLPVANILGSLLGKIQIEMLKLDLGQIASAGDTVFSAQDTGYLIFMVIGIVAYFTVPNVASFVVDAGGGGALLQKVTSAVIASSKTGANSVMGGMGGMKTSLGNIANAGAYFREGRDGGLHSGEGLSGAFGRMLGKSEYLNRKLDDRGTKKE